jgi:predicted transcriptional regulator of viral defense system
MFCEFVPILTTNSQGSEMPGRVYSALRDHAIEQGGYVTTRDAVELDVNPRLLHKMGHRGVLQPVSRGVFRFPDMPATPLDPYIEATLWPLEVRGVLSHETALDLHDLCDINPARIHVTVPRSFRTIRQPPAVLELHRENLAPEDCSWHEGIPIVTVYRAILGSIEHDVGWHLLEQAIVTARERGRLSAEQANALRRHHRGERARRP